MSASRSPATSPDLAQRDAAADRLQRVLILVAAILVTAFLAFVAVAYRVPWGGRFNAQRSGPVSEWFTALVTSLALLGLGYELVQVRRSRLDEAVRESNSLVSSIAAIPWKRHGEVEGSALFVYLENAGERKAVAVDVRLEIPFGQPVPLTGEIFRAPNVVIPPRVTKRVRVLVVHVPGRGSLGPSSEPVVVVEWTDAWNRRLRMVDNGPAELFV